MTCSGTDLRLGVKLLLLLSYLVNQLRTWKVSFRYCCVASISQIGTDAIIKLGHGEDGPGRARYGRGYGNRREYDPEETSNQLSVIHFPVIADNPATFTTTRCWEVVPPGYRYQVPIKNGGSGDESILGRDECPHESQGQVTSWLIRNQDSWPVGNSRAMATRCCSPR